MRRMSRRRLVAALIGAAYLAGLAVVSLWPTHVDGPGGLIDVRPIFDVLSRLGVPTWRSYPWVEFGGNVLMFVPFGVLVAIAATRRCLWLAPASAFAVSGIFEVLQAMTLPSRTPDARDVIAATIGAFVGAVAGWAIPATRRTPPSIASQGPRSGT